MIAPIGLDKKRSREMDIRWPDRAQPEVSKKTKIKLLWPPLSNFLTHLGGSGVGGSVAVYSLPLGLGVLKTRLKEVGFHNVNIEDVAARLAYTHSKTFFWKCVYRMRRGFNERTMTDHLLKGKTSKHLDSLAKDILTTVDYKGYDLIGISCQSWSEYNMGAILAKRIKEETGTPIVLGGPYVTLNAHNHFDYMPWLDFMCRGNGEDLMVDLARHIDGEEVDLANVKGLLYRDSAGVAHTNPPIMNDPNQECVPDFDDLDLRYYYKWVSGKWRLEIPYRTNQGCSMRCSFCTYPAIDKLRFKAADKVVADLKFLSKKYNSDCFLFTDSALNIWNKELKEVCRKIIADPELDIVWSAYTKASSGDEELIQLMKDSGCFCMEWGIESGSDHILRWMDKGYDRKTAGYWVDYARDMGVLNSVNLIFGHPHETLQDAEDHVSFILEHCINPNTRYAMNIFGFEPNSVMYKRQDHFKLEKIEADEVKIYDRRISMPFNEVGGLQYKDRLRTTRRHYRYALRRIFNHIKKTSPNPFIKFIPASVYVFAHESRRRFDVLSYALNLLGIDTVWNWISTNRRKELQQGRENKPWTSLQAETVDALL